MGFTLAEGLVRAVKDYVEEKLPAKLTALNEEYSDEIVLKDPVKTYVGWKSLATIPAGDFPVLYVLSPMERFRATELVSGTVQAVGESEPELSLGVLVMEQDKEALDPQLRRYTRALVEVLLEGMASVTDPLKGWILSTDEPWEADRVSARYSEAANSPFVGELMLTIRGWKMETRTD